MRRLVFLSALWLASLNPVLAQTVKEHRLAVLAASSHGLEFVRTGPSTELPGLARALVASRPSAIVALDGISVAAVRGETTTIPVVMFGADPVELGFAQSLARPDTNITGLIILPAELDAKPWGTMEWLHLQDGCSYIVPDKFAGAYAPCSCRPSSQLVTSTRE